MPACRPLVAALGFLAVALPVLADRPAASRSKTYGTDDLTILTLGPCDARFSDSEQRYSTLGCFFLRPPLDAGVTGTLVNFPLHLPEGALIEELTFLYWDSIVGFHPITSLMRYGADATPEQYVIPLPAFDQGFNTHHHVLNPPIEIRNNDGNYTLHMFLEAIDPDHYYGLRRVTVGYRLQVSPAPGTATFADVPTNHTFFQFVEALASSGITAGCGGGNFCPNQPLTRGQMAVFLSKGLGLHFAP